MMALCNHWMPFPLNAALRHIQPKHFGSSAHFAGWNRFPFVSRRSTMGRPLNWLPGAPIRLIGRHAESVEDACRWRKQLFPILSIPVETKVFRPDGNRGEHMSESHHWSNPGEFDRLMEEVRAGSQDAAWELLERVGPHVHRVVHRMLNRELRSKFDSMDFVQAVWASFFVNRRQIAAFARPEQLIGFLVAMARNKVIGEHRRRMMTAKYDVRRETAGAAEVGSISETQVHPEASPSQFAMARECWNQLVSGQPELHQQIVVRKFMGDTHEEIAANLGINRRTITRILNQLVPYEQAS